MEFDEIVIKARTLGIAPGGRGADELVRAIQAAEGNTPCFRSGRVVCEYMHCSWYADCVEPPAETNGEPTAIGARTGKWRR
jgi:hypothetical protein